MCTNTPRRQGFLEAGQARTAEANASGSERQRPVQAGIALPFNSGPKSFRAVAMPLVFEMGGEAVNYRLVLGSMLERVRHYPKTARQRGAKGSAVIGFVLDLAGKITSVFLLRSSGDADLDTESVALVNRAAPFPPPPAWRASFLCDRSWIRHGKLGFAFYRRIEGSGRESGQWTSPGNAASGTEKAIQSDLAKAPRIAKSPSLPHGKVNHAIRLEATTFSANRSFAATQALLFINLTKTLRFT